MKCLLRVTIVLWLAVWLQNCAEDENAGAVEKVQFTFDFKTVGPDGGRVQATADLPPGTSLLVSIDNFNGETVLGHFRIELLKVRDSYMSNPIELLPGRYRLTDFMLVSGDSVLYATPRSGSPFATAVVHALPFNFSVRKDAVTNIPMEVVDVSQSEPEDFGYVSFNVSVMEGEPFQISIFIPSENGMNLTTANAFILKDGDTLSTYAFKAKVNTIFFKEDEDEHYTLVVSKDGYGAYSREFIFTDLLAELNDKPLAVILEPALTMVIKKSIQAWLDTNSPSARFQVNWGDGSVEELQGYESYGLFHDYASAGKYTVTITGDLNTINGFTQHGINGPLSIDFLHTKALANVEIVASPIETIRVPEGAPLRRIVLEECPNFMKEALEVLIQDRYTYVVNNDFTGGEFIFTKDMDGDLIGPPSQSSFDKLRIMKDTYHWHATVDYYAYHLDLVYEKEFDGGLFPGAFKEKNHVRFDITVAAFPTPIIRFLGLANGQGTSVTPGSRTEGECTSVFVTDYYYSEPLSFLDPLIYWPAAIATLISPGQGKPLQLRIDFKNQPSKEPMFEIGCPFGPDNRWIGGAQILPDVMLPDATFILNHEVQVYHNPANTVTGTLTPILFN